MQGHNEMSIEKRKARDKTEQVSLDDERMWHTRALLIYECLPRDKVATKRINKTKALQSSVPSSYHCTTTTVTPTPAPALSTL